MYTNLIKIVLKTNNCSCERETSMLAKCREQVFANPKNALPPSPSEPAPIPPVSFQNTAFHILSEAGLVAATAQKKRQNFRPVPTHTAAQNRAKRPCLSRTNHIGNGCNHLCIGSHPALLMRWRERRKPKLLLRLSGVLLLRFETRQFSALLFQLPPRFTRLSPLR